MKSTRQQRAWYWYDWANSAYVTTTATVILGPYLTSIATRAACPDLSAGEVCSTPVNLLGFAVLPGAVHPFLVTISTILSLVALLIIGVIADRSKHPQWWLGGLAWVGAAAASAMFFVADTNWQLGAVLMIVWFFFAGSKPFFRGESLNRDTEVLVPEADHVVIRSVDGGRG